MSKDLSGQFEVQTIDKDMWMHFELFLLVHLRQHYINLQMCFDSYEMDWKYLMTEHLRKMSVVLCALNVAGNILSKEQHIQAVLRALPKYWIQ